MKTKFFFLCLCLGSMNASAKPLADTPVDESHYEIFSEKEIRQLFSEGELLNVETFLRQDWTCTVYLKGDDKKMYGLIDFRNLHYYISSEKILSSIRTTSNKVAIWLPSEEGWRSGSEQSMDCGNSRGRQKFPVQAIARLTPAGNLVMEYNLARTVLFSECKYPENFKNYTVLFPSILDEKQYLATQYEFCRPAK